ncbi:MAG TPA: metallophosphoesterase [Candidatus Acidoferrales bacterium]
MNPARRRFVHAATMAAGAIPFAAAGYGFVFERFRYQIRKIDLPIPGLPPQLAGLRIAQLSDIHIGVYLSAADVRRAVTMANDLRADLTVVTGDFVTGVSDPLEDCIAELSRLRAPLGVWGCNGNHEIYADVEARAAELFESHGMRLLRQQSAELTWRGQPFNLLGVDYQRERDADGIARPMLGTIETLVRRDVPNILLSHNPNSFRRAAQLGIELMLAGHTHGGQVTVEILDHRLSAARFLTPYVAGMYLRPLGVPAGLEDDDPAMSAARVIHGPSAPAPAVLYVNRGLGTIAMPVRIGVPPEITLHTLHRA